MPAAMRGAGRGRYVVLTGPDGTGKSSLADALSATVGKSRPVRRFHDRLRVLPATRHLLQQATEPHARAPHSAWVSAGQGRLPFYRRARSWLVRVRPFVRDGGSAIVERGWWDLVVHPRHYRLAEGSSSQRGLAASCRGRATSLFCTHPLSSSLNASRSYRSSSWNASWSAGVSWPRCSPGP